MLIPVFGRDELARVVFTKRPGTMAAHQGQIVFPGGKVDRGIDASPRHTALREAEEEIGLSREVVDVVAELPAVETVVSGFVMTPFVGVVEPLPALVPHPYEVDRVFDVSIAELLDEDAYRSEIWSAVSADEWRVMHFFDVAGETIWGATARILAALLEDLTGTSPRS